MPATQAAPIVDPLVTDPDQLRTTALGLADRVDLLEAEREDLSAELRILRSWLVDGHESIGEGAFMVYDRHQYDEVIRLVDFVLDRLPPNDGTGRRRDGR